MPVMNVPAEQIATLKQWQAGTNSANGEAILLLDLWNDQRVIVQMNHISAREMGAELSQIAAQIAPKGVN